MSRITRRSGYALAVNVAADLSGDADLPADFENVSEYLRGQVELIADALAAPLPGGDHDQVKYAVYADVRRARGA